MIFAFPDDLLLTIHCPVGSDLSLMDVRIIPRQLLEMSKEDLGNIRCEEK